MLMRSRAFLAGVLLAVAVGVTAATSGGFPSRPRLQSLGVNATPPATGSITASGTITGATLAGAYNASGLTGSIADARLSANVSLKDAANTFTVANNRFSASPLLLTEATTPSNAYIAFGDSASGPDSYFGWSSATNGLVTGSARRDFIVRTSGTFRVSTNDGTSTAVAVAPAGNVTIAGPSSGVPLTVNRSGAGQVVTAVNGSVTGFLSSDGSTSFDIGSQTNHALNIYTNSAVRAVVGAGGGMVIGSPTGGNEGAGTLNVASGVYDNGIRLPRIAQAHANSAGTISRNFNMSFTSKGATGFYTYNITAAGFTTVPICIAAATNGNIIASVTSTTTTSINVETRTVGNVNDDQAHDVICTGL